MTLVTATFFGLAPVLRSIGDRAASSLRDGARSVGSGREGLRSALVVAEVAVSVVLLISSGLLLRALLRVQATPPGFTPAGVVTLRTTLPMPKYQSLDKRVAFHAGVVEQVRALPGVESAAYVSFLPMVMTGGIWTIEAEGHPTQPGEGRTASMRYVTPGYFQTLGIPLVAGRDVSDADTAGTLQVAVVSQSFVDRYWPGENAIGRRFRFGLLGGDEISNVRPFQDRTVVGVVGDVKVRGLERRSEPQAYLPHRQQPEDAIGWYTPATSPSGTRATPPRSFRRCAGSWPAPTRPSRSPTCARSRRSWRARRPRAACRCACWPASPRWPCCSRASASTACSPSSSPAARARSASGARSAPRRATS